VRNLVADGKGVIAVDVPYKLKDHRLPAGVVLMESDELRRSIRIQRKVLDMDLTHILHLGACSNTRETMEAIMYDANVLFAREMFAASTWNKIRLVYASSAAVYGNSQSCVESAANEQPLNLYGRSKAEFDRLMRSNMAARPYTIVGLRFFNVYGPAEKSKGRMASMPYQIYSQIKETGVCRLFGETAGYAPGEQRRDFIHVDDVVNVIRYFAFATEDKKGIFNVGSGVARSFNDVANNVIRLMGTGQISYMPFPQELVGQYQMSTCADLTALRAAGYTESFLSLEDGLARAVQEWNKEG
jgi:ADP-L-glycero-D-manno-heptose 6-epimerase